MLLYQCLSLLSGLNECVAAGSFTHITQKKALITTSVSQNTDCVCFLLQTLQLLKQQMFQITGNAISQSIKPHQSSLPTCARGNVITPTRRLPQQQQKRTG